MVDINNVLYRIRAIDDMGDQDTWIHRINPTVKLIVTFFYVIKVIALKEFYLRDIISIILYITIITLMSKVSIKPILKRALIVLPVVIGIGGINLFFYFTYSQMILSALLLFKGLFSVIGVLLFISTTGINNVAAALRTLKVPKILVAQLLLTYRYIMVLLEEGYRLKCAYELRTGNKTKIDIKVWGQIIGQMLLRSIDRAEMVYSAMKLRGFEGEYYISCGQRLKSWDILYTIICITLFILL
ncbi:cobalt ECF transporter T component CbiQ [Clostridium polyendosporum]|uniref:Cobalt ECF transporter T component CbiQ n=1 Tax=Clostridium polyendosporum TaxID=69208 RepID=A0A919S2H4_9CLOT|nr:energy-coupling factor transporter transmembrane component T [Clostridium polyendosporum]GIM30639.1 cobalt ECF transporter T component CbiQ [Clostridium polyendosporum]